MAGGQREGQKKMKDDEHFLNDLQNRKNKRKTVDGTDVEMMEGGRATEPRGRGQNGHRQQR